MSILPGSITNQIIKLVQDEPDNKIEFKELMNGMKELNTGTKAELATKLIIDKEVLKKTVTIMGKAIDDAEIEIEALEAKNAELEKDLTPSQREKANKLYHGKKELLINDQKSNERIMRRLNKVMTVSKQLTEK
jgi:hypothetical protein